MVAIGAQVAYDPATDPHAEIGECGSAFYAGPLLGPTAHLDRAIYAASCLCGHYGPHTVFGAPYRANTPTEELYVVVGRGEEPPEGWEPVYTITRGDAR